MGGQTPNLLDQFRLRLLGTLVATGTLLLGLLGTLVATGTLLLGLLGTLVGSAGAAQIFAVLHRVTEKTRVQLWQSLTQCSTARYPYIGLFKIY